MITVVKIMALVSSYERKLSHALSHVNISLGVFVLCYLNIFTVSKIKIHFKDLRDGSETRNKGSLSCEYPKPSATRWLWGRGAAHDELSTEKLPSLGNGHI